MEKITETLSLVLEKMEKMEKRMVKMDKKMKALEKKEGGDSDTEPKRPPNPWLIFIDNVRALLKENEMEITEFGELPQFCSALREKKSDYASWSEEEILEERGNWVKPEKSKKELSGKSSKKTTPASSVAKPKKAKALPASDDEGMEVEMEVEVEVKKKPGRPKKVVEEVKKPVEKKAVEKKEAKKPKKKVVEEDENYTGNIEAFKFKNNTYAKTDRHDVIDEDECKYVGRWNEETNEIDYKFPEPVYVKKMIAAMNSDDEE